MATAKKTPATTAKTTEKKSGPLKFALGTKVTWKNRLGFQLTGKTISPVELRGPSHWIKVRDASGEETSVRPTQLTRI